MATRRFPRKPKHSELVRNLSHPLWRKVFQFLPFTENVSRDQDYPNGFVFKDWSLNDWHGTVTAASTIRQHYGESGIGVERISLDQNRISFGLANSIALPTGNVTVAMLVRKLGANRASYSFGMMNSAAANYCHALAPWSDGVTYWDWGGTGSGNRVSDAGAASHTGTHLRVYTVGPRGMEIWEDGVRLAVNTGASGATRTNSNEDWNLGTGATIAGDTTITEMFGVWRRQLSQPEIAELTNDPFVMLRPPVGERFPVTAKRSAPQTMSLTAPVPTFSVTGQRAEDGTVAITAPVPTLAATGYTVNTATAAIDIPVPTLSLTGTVKTMAAVAIDIPIPTLAVTANASTPVLITGTIAIDILIPTVYFDAIPAEIEIRSGDFTVPVPTMIFQAPHDQVGSPAEGPGTDGSNWEWMVDNMSWEGYQVLSNIARVTAPPGARPTDRFWEAFQKSTSGKCLHIALRERPGEDYVDLWFTHYWGHTDWTKADDAATQGCYWEDVAATPFADSITIGVTALADFGLYELENKYGKVLVGSGQAMQTRKRITFLSFQNYQVGEVINDVVAGHALPFYTEISPPSNVTDKTTTLQNQIDGDDGYPAWSQTNQSGHRQFEGHSGAVPHPGQTGSQARFGMTHTSLDIWAEPTGDEDGVGSREVSWYDRLSRWANYPGQYVEPDGTIWDPDDVRWSSLCLHTTGTFHPNSTGYSSQAWFQPNNHLTVANGFPSERKSSWACADLTDLNNNTPKTWQVQPRSHYGHTAMAQYVQRHADPGILRLLRHQKSFIRGHIPTSNRGTSNHTPNSHRARGRTLMAMVAMLHVEPDAALENHIVEWIDILLDHQDDVQFGLGFEDANAKRPHSSQAPGYCYAPWEVALYISGLWFATTVDLTPGDPMKNNQTRLERLTDFCGTLAGFVLDSMALEVQGWRVEYEVDKDAVAWTSPASSATNGLTFWCTHGMMVAHYHLRSYLSSGQETKLDGFIDEFADSLVTANTNWHEVIDYHYRPTSTLVTNTDLEISWGIPTPTIFGPAGAINGWVESSDISLNLGSLTISIPSVPVFSVPDGAGTVATTIELGIVIPVFAFASSGDAVTDLYGFLGIGDIPDAVFNPAQSEGEQGVGLVAPVAVFAVADGDGQVTSDPSVHTGTSAISIPVADLSSTTVFVIPPFGTATGAIAIDAPVPTFLPWLSRSGSASSLGCTFTVPVPITAAGEATGTNPGTMTFTLPIPAFYARSPTGTGRELPLLYGEGISILPDLQGATLTITDQVIELTRGDDVRQPFIITLDQARTLDGTETWKFQMRALKSDSQARMSLTSPTQINIDSEAFYPSVIFTPADMPVSEFPDLHRTKTYLWDLEMTKGGKVETVASGTSPVTTDVSR